MRLSYCKKYSYAERIGPQRHKYFQAQRLQRFDTIQDDCAVSQPSGLLVHFSITRALLFSRVDSWVLRLGI